MPHNNQPLLDLDTLIDRPVVAIDGVKYEILSADELSVLDSARFGRWGRRIKELGEADEIDADGEAELEQLVKRVARRVLVGVPDDVFDTLTGANRWAVVDLFTGLLLRRAMRVAGAMQKAAGMEMASESESRPIGARFSRGSSVSTADRRPSGWSDALQRWFGLT